MKAYKRMKIRLTVGITALIVAMTSSSFRAEIGGWFCREEHLEEV